MNIALLAHNQKKELMTNFCIAYKNILRHHNLMATGATGMVVSEATGLEIHKFSPGAMGGVQQIASRINYNEIDMVIIFSDPFHLQGSEPDFSEIFRLCDIYSIPFATNIATAELLVKGLERGDLEWRDLIRNNSN